MTALAWLNDLAQWFGRWIPRLILIEVTHLGVLFGPKGSVRQVGPGLVMYWPITHALLQMPMTTQSVQLSGQALHALDLQEGAFVPRVRICSAAVQFRVSDAVQAATKALSLHALIDNRGQAAIAAHAGKPPAEWLDAARVELAHDLEPFGVSLERLDFTQLGIGVAIKNVESGNWHDQNTGTRPTA